MPWDWQTAEIKGADLRKNLKGTRRERRGTIGFIDRTLDLIEEFDGRFAARVWLKQPGGPFDGRAVYTMSVQWLCERFQILLGQSDENGILIADSRSHAPNVNVAHSIFTQKLKATGDPYPNLVEVPVFGHSDNHAGLQIADVISSALLAPICCQFFLGGILRSRHVASEFESVGERYVPRLRPLLFAPPVGSSSSLLVHNVITKKGHTHLFRKFCESEGSGVTDLKIDT
jgi:hypothetical protein